MYNDVIDWQPIVFYFGRLPVLNRIGNSEWIVGFKTGQVYDEPKNQKEEVD